MFRAGLPGFRSLQRGVVTTTTGNVVPSTSATTASVSSATPTAAAATIMTTRSKSSLSGGGNRSGSHYNDSGRTSAVGNILVAPASGVLSTASRGQASAVASQAEAGLVQKRFVSDDVLLSILHDGGARKKKTKGKSWAQRKEAAVAAKVALGQATNCPYCEKVFEASDNSRTVKQHLKESHWEAAAAAAPAPAVQGEGEEKRKVPCFNCAHCSQSFTDFGQLYRHLGPRFNCSDNTATPAAASAGEAASDTPVVDEPQRQQQQEEKGQEDNSKKGATEASSKNARSPPKGNNNKYLILPSRRVMRDALDRGQKLAPMDQQIEPLGKFYSCPICRRNADAKDAKKAAEVKAAAASDNVGEKEAHTNDDVAPQSAEESRAPGKTVHNGFFAPHHTVADIKRHMLLQHSQGEKSHQRRRAGVAKVVVPELKEGATDGVEAAEPPKLAESGPVDAEAKIDLKVADLTKALADAQAEATQLTTNQSTDTDAVQSAHSKVADLTKALEDAEAVAKLPKLAVPFAKCKGCATSFPDAKSFLDHFDYQDENLSCRRLAEATECPFCDEAFTADQTDQAVSNHIVHEHWQQHADVPREKPFKCPRCFSTFRLYTDLVGHLNASWQCRAPIQPRLTAKPAKTLEMTVTCPYCPHSIPQHSVMKRKFKAGTPRSDYLDHFKKYHWKSEGSQPRSKPFFCECGLGFYTLNEYTSHMKWGAEPSSRCLRTPHLPANWKGPYRPFLLPKERRMKHYAQSVAAQEARLESRKGARADDLVKWEAEEQVELDKEAAEEAKLAAAAAILAAEREAAEAVLAAEREAVALEEKKAAEAAEAALAEAAAKVAAEKKKKSSFPAPPTSSAPSGKRPTPTVDAVGGSPTKAKIVKKKKKTDLGGKPTSFVPPVVGGTAPPVFKSATSPTKPAFTPPVFTPPPTAPPAFTPPTASKPAFTPPPSVSQPAVPPAFAPPTSAPQAAPVAPPAAPVAPPAAPVAPPAAPVAPPAAPVAPPATPVAPPAAPVAPPAAPVAPPAAPVAPPATPVAAKKEPVVAEEPAGKKKKKKTRLGRFT